MKPRSVECLTQMGCAALVAAICMAPGVATPQDMGSSVPYRDAPFAVPLADNFGAAPQGKSVGLVGFNHGDERMRLSVAPSAAVGTFHGGEQQSGGVEVRFGADNDAEGPSDGDWFVFAGAQRKAVEWDRSGSAFDVEMVDLNKSATVGDLKAGVAYQMGPAQMSLGYMKRSYKSGDLSEKRSYAAISVSFRR